MKEPKYLPTLYKICPTCKRSLPKEVTRKTRCHKCGSELHLISDPITREPVVINNAQLEEFWFDNFKDYLIDNDIARNMGELNEVISLLQNKTKSIPAKGDILWALFNRRIRESAINSVKNASDLYLIYSQMASLLFEEKNYKQSLINFALAGFFDLKDKLSEAQSLPDVVNLHREEDKEIYCTTKVLEGGEANMCLKALKLSEDKDNILEIIYKSKTPLSLLTNIENHLSQINDN